MQEAVGDFSDLPDGKNGDLREGIDVDPVASRDRAAARERPRPERSRELDPTKPGLTQAEQGDDGCQPWDDEPPEGDSETLLKPKGP